MGNLQRRLADLAASPRSFLKDPDPATRRLAVSACARSLDDDAVRVEIEAILAGDADPRVRAEAAEVLGGAGEIARGALMAAAADPDARVREAIATALGELPPDPSAVDLLMEMASGDGDKLVREAAVASLGALGDGRAVPLLIALSAEAPPQIRRRAVVALTVFDGPEVEAAIRAALDDRNPMVREAAEMIAGRRR